MGRKLREQSLARTGVHDARPTNLAAGEGRKDWDGPGPAAARALLEEGRTWLRLQDFAEAWERLICWEGTRLAGGGTWERSGWWSRKDPSGNLGGTTGSLCSSR